MAMRRLTFRALNFGHCTALKWLAYGLIATSILLPADGLTLAWDANREPDIAGYKLYYHSGDSPYSVLDTGKTTQATLDTLAEEQTYSFYVVAYNTAGLTSEPSESISYTTPTRSDVHFYWEPTTNKNLGHYTVSFSVLHDDTTLTNYNTTNTFLDFKNLIAGNEYFFWVNAYDSSGTQCELYRPIGIKLPKGHSDLYSYRAYAVYRGWTRQGGDWVGKYGKEGYWVASAPDEKSPYIGALTNATYWVWNTDPSDSAALQTPDGNSRLSACWYSQDGLSVSVSFPDDKIHRVTVYCIDYEDLDLKEFFYFSGYIGDVTNFKSPGLYLSFDVKGSALLKMTPTSGPYVTVSGFFIDDFYSLGQ
jgi:hypothetical protein